MGIDRLDEGDAPSMPPDRGDHATARQPDSTVTEETRDPATYYAELRAAVEAASDRERSGYQLSPEANSEITKGCERIRENGENVIIPPLRHIEAKDSDRHLIGLEYVFKGTERIKEKVARTLEEQPNILPGQALRAVPDAVRFTFRYEEDRYTSGVYADLERLTAQGFELAKPLKNSWDSDQYKGINTQWREPTSGQLFEVQFHTRASFEAKQLSHPAYERTRNPQTSDAELDELEDFQRRVFAQVPIPRGATEIAYFPGKERDG